MQEVARRLQGSVSDDPSASGYVRSVSPPADLTATWVPVDANGNRTGNNRVYDPATGEWTDDFGSGVPGVIFISAQEGNQIVNSEQDGGIYVAPGKGEVIHKTINTNGTFQIPFTAMGVDVNKIAVNINYTSDPGANADFRYYIESLVDGELKLKVLGFNNTIVPSVEFRIEISAI